MKFEELRPILWIEKLDETIEFYTTILDFICNERNDDWGMREFAIYDNNGFLITIGD